MVGKKIKLLIRRKVGARKVGGVSDIPSLLIILATFGPLDLCESMICKGIPSHFRL